MTRPKSVSTLKVIIAIILINVFDCVDCILNNQDTLDITNDRNFNCHWTGGSDPKLTCDCLTDKEEFVIKHNSIPVYDVAMIKITNCGKITIGANAFAEMRSLRSITLENIKSIVLEADSISWLGSVRNRENLIDWDPSVPSIRVYLISSNIDLIANNAIHGRINLLEIINCDIQHMSSFAVSRLQQMLNIRITGSTFHQLETQSFKRFTTENLIITNTAFATIPSRAFYELTVRDQFLLDNITVYDTLKPSGFTITNPYNFQMLNSHINAIAGSGFKVATRGPVVIQNNRFHNTANSAFRSISLNKEDPNEYETIKFERNIFDQLSKDALVVDKDSFRPVFVNLQLTEKCECGNLERYFRHDENTLELSCMSERDSDEWVSVDHFQSTRCGMLDTKSGTAYIIAGVCAIVVVIVGSIVGFYFIRLHRSKSYDKNSTDKNGKVSMIVPDGRTYRETELCVIVERADLLTTDL